MPSYQILAIIPASELTAAVSTASAADRARQRMARRLGFESVREFEAWEEEVAIDHFANFICDYLAQGYTLKPEKRGFVEYVDLDKAVEERIEMLEARRFEMVLDPDKSECEFPSPFAEFLRNTGRSKVDIGC